MKKSFSFLSLLLCLPLVFCGMMFISNFSTFSSKAEGEIIYLANETNNLKGTQSFSHFVENYDSSSQNASIVLAEDIDLSGVVLTNTIGTESVPFSGTFDGKGYSISNFTFADSLVDENVKISTNIGIFGYTSGATIKNLQISGTYGITLYNSSSVNIGMLVGYGVDTTIDKVLINANFNQLNVQAKDGSASNFKNINFGGIAGFLQSSSIKNTIIRNQAERYPLPEIVLNNSVSVDIAKIGGMVGNLDNSSIIFSVGQSKVVVSVDEVYSGNVYVGGVAGYISGANSKLINLVSETTLSVEGKAYAGRIGGYISNPAPAKNNISYIYYFDDAQAISTFGEKGNYSLTDAEANLSSQTRKITSYANDEGIENYFKTKFWNVAYGDHWDFTNTWRYSEQNINLQPFIDSFNLTAEVNDVLEITTDFVSPYKYEDVASFTFKFKNQEAEGVSANYYHLSNLTLAGNTVANFKYDEENDVYSLVAVKGYERISMAEPEVKSDGTYYTITIEGVTSNYRGHYAVNIKPETFVGVFNYRLYNEKNEVVNESILSECYVYHTDGQNKNSRYVIIDDLTFDYTCSISTTSNSTSLYAFRGWYLVGAGENGEDLLLSEDNLNPSREITIKFGHGNFTENFEVYAKYVSDACNLTFEIMDDGVSHIILGNDQYNIQETQTIPIFKQLTELRMEVYIKPNYTFDVERFMDVLNTYKIQDDGVDFCTLVGDGGQILEDGTIRYQFNLNLANLNDADFEDGFPMTFTTVFEGGGNNNLVWIIVGSVLGGLLLIGLVILIVFLVRRRGGGSGGGGKIRSSFKKGAYY